ncbi:hypothetical protein EYC80_000917 [Monilinia laxa]|uniref:Uncharacterized protein n=1 Tax=Monilinia laxa TaxID=61186 RepID=A0A5N6K7F9_MONLA|nr:hypothetical protein EYC80_000917 [Monilinia laxa]
MSKLPRSDAPYTNNENTAPVKQLPKKPKTGKFLESIVPHVGMPGFLFNNQEEIWRVFPMGWWRCSLPGCPVGAHALGEQRCPEFWSNPRNLNEIPKTRLFPATPKYWANGHMEGERDPIQDLFGYWHCLVEGCRRRVELEVSTDVCYCELTTFRDLAVKAGEDAKPEPSTVENVKRRLEVFRGNHGKSKQTRERTPEEEIDVLEGGLDGEFDVLVRKGKEKAKVPKMDQKNVEVHHIHTKKEFDMSERGFDDWEDDRGEDHGEGSGEPRSWLY